jgi:hypothetical protein
MTLSPAVTGITNAQNYAVTKIDANRFSIATSGFSTAASGFATLGSWQFAVPANISKLRVSAVGSYCSVEITNGNGDTIGYSSYYGGLSIGVISVTPASTMTVTVNSSVASAGTISASGANCGGSTQGTGTGGDIVSRGPYLGYGGGTYSPEAALLLEW